MVPGEATLAETDAMFDKLKKTALATALAATALASASPAMAQDYRHRRHDDTGTAVAVAAGVLGLIAVAAIASDHGNKRDRRCDGDRDDPDYCYRTYNQGYYGTAITRTVTMAVAPTRAATTATRVITTRDAVTATIAIAMTIAATTAVTTAVTDFVPALAGPPGAWTLHRGVHAPALLAKPGNPG